MVQTQAQCIEIINEEITMQVLDVLKENSTQAQTQGRNSQTSSILSQELLRKHTKNR
jgi:hypothetical protein